GSASKLSGGITNTDPAYGKEGVFGVALKKFDNFVREAAPIEGYEDLPEAKEAAGLLNEFTVKSHAVLEESLINKKRAGAGKLPANIILARDAGDRLPKFPRINELFSLKFGCFVQMPV
ncbi:MAG: phosphoglycerate mutase, partial [Candidatus Omnitrophica bacterium]|nr:phosphoglycerate mutase [Candidatus Omnitrophota bacterium]